MKTMTTADFKANFSSVVDELKKGNEIAITYGRNKKVLATVVPQSKMIKPDYSVKLGDIKEEGWTYSMNNFEMTESEFLGL